MNRGTLRVTSCIFRNNAVRSAALDASAVGGAIALIGSASSLSATNTTFLNNSVQSPLGSYGGAIGLSSQSNITLSTSTFKFNRALHGAALSVSDGIATVHSCKMSSNTAVDEGNLDSVPATGGGIYLESTVAHITASTLDWNSAVRGGAIMAQKHAVVECSTCTLQQNSAIKFGGAVAAEHGSSFSSAQSVFNGSSALKGGAVYTKLSRFASTGCTFTRNIGSETAGVFYIVSAVSFEVSNSELTLNKALSAVGGGVIYFDTASEGNVIFRGSNFSQNTASHGPGGVAVVYGNAAGGELGFNDCSFEENKAAQVGGALGLWNVRGHISDCHFKKNAVAARQQGSSLYLSQGSQPVISKTRFQDHRDDTGTAVLVIDNSSPLVQQCTFMNNTFATSVVRTIENSFALFSGCVFKFNRAVSTVPSSVLQLDGYGTGKVSNCTFSHNQSPGGAALYLGVRMTAQLMYSTFKSNTATMTGGALIVNSTKVTTILECNFSYNQALGSAGAVYLSPGAKARFIRSSFLQNSAGEAGGALATAVNVQVDVQDSKFTLNSAGTQGGAISFSGDSQSLTTSTYVQQRNLLNNNLALVAGGAVFWDAVTVDKFQSCIGCAYSNNSVSSVGYGADHATDVSAIHIPTASQQDFRPGVETGNSSFFMNLVDHFGQVVSSPSGSGILCTLEWDHRVNQASGDRVRFSQRGVVTFPEISLTAYPGTTTVAGFNCSFPRCDSFGAHVKTSMSKDKTIQVLPCRLGEYREMERALILSEEDGLYYLQDTGKIKKCIPCPRGSFSTTLGATSCEICPVGADCPGGSALIPHSGYWKADPDSGRHYKCSLDGCPGGINTTCNAGYEGKICGLCQDNHAHFAFGCESCKDWRLYTPIALMAACVVVLYFWYRAAAKSADIGEKIYARQCLVLTQIFATHCQMLFLVLIILTNGIPWPAFFREFIGTMRFIDFNLINLLPMECIFSGSVDHFYSFVMSIVLQFILFGLFVIMWRDESRRPSVKWVLVAFELLYPGTCMTSLSIFYCREIEGTSYLVNDVSRICFDGEWMPYGISGAGSAMFFLITIPVVCFLHVYKNHADLDNPEFHNTFGCLYEAFKDEQWFCQSVIYIKKFALVGAIIFVAPGSATQVAIAFCLAYFFLMYQMRYAPYCDVAANQMQLISSLNLVVTLFCGLGLQVHLCKDEQGTSRLIVTIALVITNILAGVLLMVLMLKSLIKVRHANRTIETALRVWSKAKTDSAWTTWREDYQRVKSDTSTDVISDPSVRGRIVALREADEIKAQRALKLKQKTDAGAAPAIAILEKMEDGTNKMQAMFRNRVGSRAASRASSRRNSTCLPPKVDESPIYVSNVQLSDSDEEQEGYQISDPGVRAMVEAMQQEDAKQREEEKQKEDAKRRKQEEASMVEIGKRCSKTGSLSRNMQKLDAPPASFFSKADSPPGPSPRVSFDLERQDPKKSLRSKQVTLDAAVFEVGDDVLDSLESPEIVIERNSPVSQPVPQPAGETAIQRIRRKKAAREVPTAGFFGDVKPPVRQPIGSFKTRTYSKPM